MSERNDILQVVMPLIRKYAPERLRNVAVTESMELSKDLGVNSSYVVEIVLILEEELRLKPGDVYAFKTVGDLVDYVLLQRSTTS